MKERSSLPQPTVLALAIAAAFAAMPAHADDQEAAALKTPQNFVEAGIASTSKDSAKFGEYSGLNKSGASVIGNFGVRGGDAYTTVGGTTRWSLSGTDLGLSSRTLRASIADQGSWSLGIALDQLRHNLSDGYQSPYLGNAGGTLFTLPVGFGLVPSSQAMTAGQLAAFQPMEVQSTRRNTSFSASVQLDARWGVTFDYNRLDQSGGKLMGYGMAGIGGASGEFVAILPNPTNYKTDTVNLAVQWRGDNGHFSATYFGSSFHEENDSVLFQTFAGANTTQTMSTPPSNTLHQFGLAGGYTFSPSTRFAGSLSQGRNVQDAPFAYDSGLMVTASPRSSLGGRVITTHADGKVTHQATRDVALTAGLKWDERDNLTPSNIYNFVAISGGNIAKYPNTPLSFRTGQLELAADWRISRDQRLRATYDREDKSRWCNDYAVGTGYPAGTNCVVATASKEDKVGLAYKLKASEAVDAKLTYSYGDRRTDSDPKAIAAFIGTNGGAAGVNAGDFPGFYPFFDASRRQHAAKAGLNWQASEQVTLSLNGRFGRDAYASTYGVQGGRSWSMNLDGTWNYSEKGSVSAYATHQRRQRDMTNIQRTTASASAASATAVAVPAGATWTNQLASDDTTVGLSVKHGGLMGGKLELTGDATYSAGSTGYSTLFNYATTTTGGVTCADAPIFSCGVLPDIRYRTTQLKLTAGWQVDKQAKVMLRVVHQRLSSNDYYYNAYQVGYTPTQVLPTSQQSPNYSVTGVGVSYVYTF